MSSKLKVAIVTEIFLPVHGGVPVAIAQLAKGLVRDGHDVLVVANKLKNDTETPDVENHQDGYKIYRANGIAYPFDYEYILSIFPRKKLHKILDDFWPDVLHLHTPWGMLHSAAYKWAHKNNAAIVGTNHIMAENADASIALGPIGAVVSPIVAATTRRLLGKCQVVTAPTKTALDIMKSDQMKTKCVAVTNGLDTEYYTPCGSQYAVRYGRYIASVGRLAEEKHLDLLISAMQKLVIHDPNARLLIAGRGPMEDKLKKQVSHEKIDENIVFLGYVSDDEKRDLLSGAVCYVNAGAAELQCIVALEALSCNTPVVLANKGATVELVVPEKNGFLFQYPNVDDLAAQIIKIWNYGWSKEAIAPYAREKIIIEHSQKISVEKYCQAYRDAISILNFKN